MKKGFKTRLLSFVLIALMALQVLPLGIMSFATEGEPVAQLTYTDADYNAVYVQKDLAYAWDAFDITESFNGKLVSWVDGTTISMSTWSWSQASDAAATRAAGVAAGAYIAAGATDYTALLPKHVDADSGLTVLDDMTFEMVLSNQWNSTGSQGHQNYTGVIQVAPAARGMLYSMTPKDATYGPIGLTMPGYYTNPDMKGGRYGQFLDMNQWDAPQGDYFLGAPMGDVYSIAISHDFTMDTATTGSLDVAYFRDAAYARQRIWGANTAAKMTALYDARYVGNFYSANTSDKGDWKGWKEDASASNLVLKFGGGANGVMKFGYHAIRMYNRALTEAELKQNHAADLFKYYGVDLSLYYACDDIEKAAVYTALQPLALGETSVAEIEGILKANNTLKYEDLYVLNGLTFAWDAFDITANFNGQMVSWVDGQTLSFGSTYAWGYMNASDGKAWKYFGEANKCFIGIGTQDFTPILPMHTDEESGLTVLDDMTFEMVLSNQWNSTGSQGHENFTGIIQIAPANPGLFYSMTPKDATYGPVGTVTPGFYTNPDGSGGRFAKFFDMNQWNAPQGDYFLGAPMGDVFSVAISHDFTMQTATTGSLDVAYFRDAAYARERIWGTNTAATMTALYDARYVGNFTSSNTTAATGGWNGWKEDASASNLVLKFGGGKNGAMKHGYHAIRMYNRALSEAELQQNHLADLFKYYEVDLSMYELLDSADKAELATALQPIALGETSKEEIEGQMLVIYYGFSEDYLEETGILSFDGYQVRTMDYAGLRSRFTVNFDAALAEGYTLVEVGAIAGIAAKGELGIDWSEEKGYYGVNGVATTIWKDGALVVDEDKIFTADDEKLHFAYTVTFEGESGNKTNYETDLQFTAYAVVEVDGVQFVLFADMTSAAFGDTVSMLEVSQHEAFAGYATSKAVIAACAE